MSEDLIRTLVEALQRLQAPQANPGPSKQPEIHGLALQPFDENEEPFNVYVLRLENFLRLKNLTGDDEETNRRKVQVLLNCLNPRTFLTLTTLTAPKQPNELKYEELLEMLINHLNPPSSEVAEQHRFVLRLQQESESVAQYVASLKKIATTCNFICHSCNASTIETHLRSQFVRGVSDNNIRERILQKGSRITFDQAVSLAVAFPLKSKANRCKIFKSQQ